MKQKERSFSCSYILIPLLFTLYTARIHHKVFTYNSYICHLNIIILLYHSISLLSKIIILSSLYQHIIISSLSKIIILSSSSKIIISSSLYQYIIISSLSKIIILSSSSKIIISSLSKIIILSSSSKIIVTLEVHITIGEPLL